MSDTDQAAFLEPGKRRRSVPLAYPLTYAGKEYREIVIARPSVGEIAQWVESLKDDSGTKTLNIYLGADGEAVPQEVLSSLDPDDDDEVTKSAHDFLPRRVRVLFGLNEDTKASAPAGGEATEPTSNA